MAKQQNWILITVIAIIAVIALVWFFKAGTGPGQAGAGTRATAYDLVQDSRMANIEVMLGAVCCVPVADDPDLDWVCSQRGKVGGKEQCESSPDCKYIC